MRQEFLQLVQKLQTDPLAAVSVSNKSNYNEILKSTYGSELIQQYGSVQNYFEKLNRDGYKNLILQEWRKNGNTKVRKGNPFEANFSEKPPQQQLPVNNHIMAQPQAGLYGTGLGITDIMNLNTNSELKARFEVENEYLKKENQRLQNEVLELKENAFKDKYDINKKNNVSENIQTAIIEIGPIIRSIFSPGESAAALNAPANYNLSEIKLQLQQLLQLPQFSDGMAELLILINNKINQEKGFYDKLLKLLNPQE